MGKLLSLLQNTQVAHGGHRTFLREIALAVDTGSSLEIKSVTLVSKNGNDSTGERGNLAKPFLTLQAAFQSVEDGDLLLLAPGVYDAATYDRAPSFTMQGLGTVANTTVKNTTAVDTSGLVTFQNLSFDMIEVVDCTQFVAEDCRSTNGILLRQSTFPFFLHGCTGAIFAYPQSDTSVLLHRGGNLYLEGATVRVRASRLGGVTLVGGLNPEVFETDSESSVTSFLANPTGDQRRVDFHGVCRGTFAADLSGSASQDYDLAGARVEGNATFGNASLPRTIFARLAEFRGNLDANAQTEIRNEQGFCDLTQIASSPVLVGGHDGAPLTCHTFQGIAGSQQVSGPLDQQDSGWKTIGTIRLDPSVLWGYGTIDYPNAKCLLECELEMVGDPNSMIAQVQIVDENANVLTSAGTSQGGANLYPEHCESAPFSLPNQATTYLIQLRIAGGDDQDAAICHNLSVRLTWS